MSENKQSGPSDDGQSPNSDGLTLTSILDDTQRADLTLLVASLTESMRRLVLDNFDSAAGLNKTLLRQGMTEDEKIMASDPSTADVGLYERERKLKEESDKNLATLKMKNLKKNALKSYDEWRQEVIQRVGQVVNSERTARSQVHKSSGKVDVPKPQAPSTTIAQVLNVSNKTVNLKFRDLFPPTKTPLTKMAMNQRTLILHSLLLLLLSLEHYNAYSRILMLNLTSSLKLPLKTFEQDEYTTAKGLLEAVKELSADAETKRKAEQNRESRKWKVSLATAAGAAIIGVTGGYAAPLVSAGVGSVMGGLGLGATTAASYLGAVAGSSLLVGGIFGAYGGRMTGQMMDNYAREVEDFQFLPVHSRSDGARTSEDDEEGATHASEHDHKLRVTICISGWLREKEEVVKPWRVLGTGAEVFALKYELEALLNLGNAMNGMVESAAWAYAQKQLISSTIFADLAAAMWPIGLMKVARVIDNPFSLAKGRSEKAGEVLADALINRAQGERPVTLIGYSLGARVIYMCLMSLAKRKAFGLVENAVLIGSPTPSDTSDWRILRSVVAGRVVNVFSENDYVLGFMYRTSAVQYGVAGLQKIEGLAGIENVDVSEDVSGHLRNRYLIGSILNKIGFEDINLQAVEEERAELVKMEAEEKEQSKLSQRRWLIRRESGGGKADEAAEGEAEAEELEKKVHDQTEKSLVTRAIEYFYIPGVPDAQDVEGKRARAESLTATTVEKTAKADQNPSKGYASLLYSKLPSMPHASSSFLSAPTKQARPSRTDAAKKINNPPVTEPGDSAEQKQSYAQQASSYLSSLPSVPVLGRGASKSPPKASKQSSKGTVHEQVSSKSQKVVSSATRVAQSTGSASTATAGMVSDTVTPTFKNALNPMDNPAVKSAQSVSKDSPVIQHTKDKIPIPVQKQTEGVSDLVGTTTQNTGQVLQQGSEDSSRKANDVSKSIIDKSGEVGQTVGGKAKETPKQGQSYTSRAASYLPTIPSMPSIPSLGFGTREVKGEGVESKDTQTTSKSISTQPGPPKLGKRTESGSQKPDDKGQSAAVSSPKKLPRISSGLKSPTVPTSLDSLVNGVRSPPTSVPTPDLIKRVSRVSTGKKQSKDSKQGLEQGNDNGKGLKRRPPKLGPRKSSGQQNVPKEPSPVELGRKLSTLVGQQDGHDSAGIKSPRASTSTHSAAASSNATPSTPGWRAATKATKSATSTVKDGTSKAAVGGRP
ncbi:hypothetical protein PV10_01916 [Exophiala mesophila]|uniref:DUF726 domain protein n=1 Tax=Exophiala mesophila TaxID=212818 RepID=A0A0D1ZW45_EXOME|nr:uncharacterized protein PV10_01916 [Exophiala mesophila]KIV98249.1 hypothetical protein PV10_01916 [Exophiala mesophila]